MGSAWRWREEGGGGGGGGEGIRGRGGWEGGDECIYTHVEGRGEGREYT